MADTNPNPTRIADASWRYVQARLAMDPGDTVYAGSYVNKPGYHGTRAENQARDRTTGRTDYSVRLPADLLGPSDKTAAYDFKYLSAASGNYTPMARRGAHVLAAFEARDPRLRGWREWLGQTDGDKTAEGLDFVTWTKRTPDPTHEWHDHEAELRAYVESWTNKLCMLSVLSGETLAAYLVRGGQLIIRPGDPPQPPPTEDNMRWFANADREGHKGMFWFGDAGSRELVTAERKNVLYYVAYEPNVVPPRGGIHRDGTQPYGNPIVRGNCDGMGPEFDYDRLAAAIAAKLPQGQTPPTAAEIAVAVADEGHRRMAG